MKNIYNSALLSRMTVIFLIAVVICSGVKGVDSIAYANEPIPIETTTQQQGWYESQYEISIDHLPYKIDYALGEKLDLTGLRVSLILFDQHGEENIVYENVDPFEYTNVFTIDDAAYNNSESGTYAITIGSTDSYKAFLSTKTQQFSVIVQNQVPIETEPVGRYESQYEICIDHMPNKLEYTIGDNLDLTGLRVSLFLYDQQGNKNIVFDNVDPMEHTNAFTVNDTDFNNTQVGTYSISIVTTDLYKAFLDTQVQKFNVDVIEKIPISTETEPIETTTMNNEEMNTTPATTESSPTTETTPTTTLTSTTNYKNITKDDFKDWAIKDYESKTGNLPANAELSINSDGNYEITLTDDHGKVLDIYTINPETAEGANISNEEVSLPQTGITSKKYLVIFVFGLLSMISGMVMLIASEIIKRKNIFNVN